VIRSLTLAIALALGAASAPGRAADAPDLDLGARARPVPAENKFAEPGYHVWCGAPVKGGDGRYHLFYSRWPKRVGFAPGWAIHSEIAYAAADRPQGPYRHVNVALPARGTNPDTGEKFWDGDVTHNANAFFRDGKYYLYYMGNRGDGKSYPLHRNNQRIGLAIAENPAGPWRRFDRPIVDVAADRTAFDSLCVTNPAACPRPDGGVLLVYKAVQFIEGKPMGGNVRYGAASADRPEGPYVKTPGRIFEADTPSAHWMVAEDPFIWFSKRYGNRFYAVTRDVVGAFSGEKGGICLFESPDGLHWSAARKAKVLGAKFPWADGSLSTKSIERPALLLEGEEPTYLFGATNGYPKDGTESYNVQIPLAAP
jgi:hypothetical protein